MRPQEMFKINIWTFPKPYSEDHCFKHTRQYLNNILYFVTT